MLCIFDDVKRLRNISIICLTAIAASTAIMSWCIYGVYKSVKADVMRTAAECVEQAYIMEMIKRMDPPAGRADEAAVRIGSYIAMAQKQGMVPHSSDTLNASFAALLHFGLDFPEGREKTDYHALDSLFRGELARRGVHPSQAFVMPVDRNPANGSGLWEIPYRVSPSSPVSHVAYITPLDGHILRRMAVMIISAVVLVVAVGVIVAYLLITVKRMRTLEQMKDDFTHNMTHELKAPVAVAISATDSMMRYYDPGDEERNRQMLGIISERLNYLSGMIEKILSVSMERFRRMELNKCPVDIRRAIDGVVRQIMLKSDKPVDISVNVTPDGLAVSTDPVHFQNILTNLLDNAVKYSGSSVRIEISATQDCLKVRDNGIGIAQVELRHIFDKFYRVTHGDRYTVQGFGIGLYYVRQVLGLLGWNMHVRSTPGNGTEFTIVWHEKR